MKIPSTNPRTVKYNVNKTLFLYLSDILIYFLMKCFNPFAPELPVTARADPRPFYPL